MEPSANLRELGAVRRLHVASLEKVRLPLADAIREDLARGVRQRDIVKATGYTREQIRRIGQGLHLATGEYVTP